MLPIPDEQPGMIIKIIDDNNGCQNGLKKNDYKS